MLYVGYLRRDAVLSPAGLIYLDWLANHINQQTSTVTDIQSRDESEDDADHGEEAEKCRKLA